MAEQYLRCPNCGANATNHQNCEYCGSLLVRFVEKGIDLSKTTYNSNVRVFPGLIDHLKLNLQLQDKGNEFVATDIMEGYGDEHSNSISIMRTGRCDWGDGQKMKLGIGNKGLIICFDFNLEEINGCQDNHSNNLYARFKALDCFPLFTSHYTEYKTGETWWQGHEYAIDFGLDAEGAARLISDILNKVFLIPLNQQIDITTNYGLLEVEAARKQLCIAHGRTYVGLTPWKATLLKIFSIPTWVIAVAVFILFCLIKCAS